MATDRVEAIKRMIADCPPEERRALFVYQKGSVAPHPLESEWNIDSDTILTAIYRSPDLTRRGVRGILAEAVFERDVLPNLTKFGWEALPLPSGDPPYDFLLRRGKRQAKIQLKLQRIEGGQPKRYRPRIYPDPLYVVEVQRTRSGTRNGEATRPYRFGDFEILVVCMQPVTRHWHDFRYTLEKWLLPRKSDGGLIEIMQPVSLTPTELWTDRLEVCLEWLLTRRQGKTFAEVYRVGPESAR